MNNDIIIIDCEASGLDTNSYPIQIAWYNMANDDQDSFYIKPHEDWLYWDIKAENIHNIPRKTLYDVGLCVKEAAERILPILQTHDTIYCDSPYFDQFWVHRLIETYEVVAKKKINKNTLSTFMHVCDLVDMDYIHIISDELSNDERSHDALDDCKSIAQCVLRAMKRINS